MATGIRLTEESILNSVIEILQHLTSDWDLELTDPIEPNTYLIADLEFESLDVIQFVVLIQEKFGRRDLPFEELLMVEGRYVEDISVQQAVDFLHKHLNS